MSAAIFAFGFVVTAIVAGACWLIITGIREEQRDRLRLEAEQAEALEASSGRRVTTTSEGRTIEAD